MSTIKLGNLLWRPHTRPISPEDPVDVKDVNTTDIKAKLEMVQSELALVKAELQEIKANQLSGDQKVQLSGTNVVIYEDPSPIALAAGEHRDITLTDLDYDKIYVSFRAYLVGKITIAVINLNPAGVARGGHPPVEKSLQLLDAVPSELWEFPVVGKRVRIRVTNVDTIPQIQTYAYISGVK